MKVLQVCNKLPFPATDGGALAMNNVSQGLYDAGVGLTVFAIVTPKTKSLTALIPSDYKIKFSFHSSFIDTSIKPVDAFLNIFSSSSYNLSRFYSKQTELQLENLLKTEKFDVIQLESIFVATYLDVIRRNSRAKVVLRAHNVEHKIWERTAELESNPVKKFYLKLMASRLKKEEMQIFEKVDGIATITHLDQEMISKINPKAKIITIPFGLSVRSFHSSPEKESRSVFHLGAMDWTPNLEGVKWFLDKVYPVLKKSGTKVLVHLAGKKMPVDILSKKSDDLIVQGEVHNGMEYMNDKGIMVVPLLSGGGMRVKIVEGMALGKAIVSTTIGAEGIECENGRNILIADSPEAFAEAIERCVKDPQLCRRLGENARKTAEEYYDNEVIIRKLLNFYKELQA